MNEKRLFHYTREKNLLKILATEEIRPKAPGLSKDEKPIVWTSYHPHFEPTAMPSIKSDPLRRISFEEFQALETPARIEINPDCVPLNWSQWRKLSGIPSKIVKVLEEFAIRCDSKTADWRMGFDTIKPDKWIAVEVFVNGNWTNIREVDQWQKSGNQAPNADSK